MTVTGSVARTTGQAISHTRGKSDGQSKTQSCGKKHFYQFMMFDKDMLNMVRLLILMQNII